MPDSKNYFILFGIITIVITSLLAFLNSRSSFFLKKQEEITNLQEENNHQEEIVKEVINNSTLLDNLIINIIIFLLIFLIAFFSVYYSDYSPVVNNNKAETIKENEFKNDFERSILRKTVLFLGKRYLEKGEYYFFYNKDNQEKNNQEELEQLKVFRRGNRYKFGDNFSLEDYHDDITVYIKNVNIEGKTIDEEIRFFFQDFYSFDRANFFFKIIREKNAFGQLKIYDYNELNSPRDEKIKKACTCDNSFEMLSECFIDKKLIFFHQSNIFAALLSYGFFFLSFFLLYFVLYFFYAFIYCLFFLNEEEIKEEEEKNKFLIAFYKTLRAITFFNIRSFYKIIPAFCFLGAAIFDAYLFFSSSLFLFPIFYDANNPNAIRTMKIHQCGDDILKKFFEFKKNQKIKISVDKNYQETYFMFLKKK